MCHEHSFWLLDTIEMYPFKYKSLIYNSIWYIPGGIYIPLRVHHITHSNTQARLNERLDMEKFGCGFDLKSTLSTMKNCDKLAFT